jgi:hypothetical protein
VLTNFITEIQRGEVQKLFQLSVCCERLGSKTAKDWPYRGLQYCMAELKNEAV